MSSGNEDKFAQIDFGKFGFIRTTTNGPLSIAPLANAGLS